MKICFVVLDILFLYLSGLALALSSPAIKPSTGWGESQGRNLNFDDWISDAPKEVTDWENLVVNGKIPDYVKGTLLRNGGGIWSNGEDDMFGHLFDGLAKVSAYRIQEDPKTSEVTVLYQNRFINSKYYRKVKAGNTLPPLISAGNVVSRKTRQVKKGLWTIMQAILNLMIFDNAPVNIWDYDPLRTRTEGAQTIDALTDAPLRAQLSLRTMETTASYTAAPSQIAGLAGYELLVTAHPLYSLTSDDTYNVATCLTLEGPSVVLLKESPMGVRRLVGQRAMKSKGSNNGIPYVHSFGLTQRYAVIFIQPLRISTNIKDAVEFGFLRSMDEADHSRVVVFDLETGGCVLDETIDEKVFFYHTVSTVEYKNFQGELEISLRLAAYSKPDMISGEDHFLRLDLCQGSKDARNRIPHGAKFCDIIANLSQNSVAVKWITLDKEQGFELPTTRHSRDFGPQAKPLNQHPKYVYAFGAYACGSEEYDSFGLFKFKPNEGKTEAWLRRDSLYTSEPIFVPDPNGTNEDDGVLLSQVYDGVRRETALFVLDARSMEVVAEVWTKNRSPTDFHGAWIPE